MLPIAESDVVFDPVKFEIFALCRYFPLVTPPRKRRVHTRSLLPKILALALSPSGPTLSYRNVGKPTIGRGFLLRPRDCARLEIGARR